MKRKIYFILNVFIIIFTSVSIIPKDALAKDAAAVQKSDDVVIISNPKTPVPKKGLKMRIVFKEELSIGVTEGDENYMFGNRVYFNTDEKGNFYVVDWDRKRIQKYDTQGKYLATIGREGQGPGEFRNVWMPRFDENGNMHVTDIANHRVTFFDKDGKFLKQIPIPVEFSVQFINSRGLFVGSQSEGKEEAGAMRWSITYGLFDDKFQCVAEIRRSTQEARGPSGRDAKSRAQFLASIYSREAFQPHVTYFLAKNDFIFFGYPEKYEIHIYSPEGKLVTIIQRDYEPIKVSKKHIDDFIDYLEDEYYRFIPTPDDVKKQVYQFIEYPKHIPPYQTFTLMENGWLAVVVDTLKNEYSLFDIFDEEGKYIAQFKANIPAENLFFKNGKAYALAIENGYRFVKRYNFEIQEY